MQLNINTQATNGQLILYVINNSGATILTLRDTDNGSCLIVPGYTYRFEWHTWSPQGADYAINANTDPVNPGFPPFSFSKSYPGPSSDMGGFYFTLN
ncbi:MAG: hypothetical protein JWR09_4240 [Mucilaginibacter sp.]|nr:hypothetical protein [Mucilaginibacter sp.]